MFTKKFYEIAGDKLRAYRDEEIQKARALSLEYLLKNHLVKNTDKEYQQFVRFYSDVSHFLNLSLTKEEVHEIAHDRTYNMNNYIVYPDAKKVVEVLSQTYKLGIISDTWPSIEEQLCAIGVRKYFSTSTYSCELGIFKSDEALYKDALKKCGCKAEETVFIDEPETPDSRELKLTLTAPEKAMVNVPFQVSLDAANCFYIDWYINEEYFPELTNEINPEGTLQFSESKFYTITVYGYSEDLTQSVSDTKIVQVYKDLSQMIDNAKEHDRAMYSWNHDFIYEENEALLQTVMERMECNILYQEVAPDADEQDVAAFLQRRGELNQTVYYLCGNASWTYEEDAASMLKQVACAVAYNEAAGEHKFVGIQFDVEPYCLLDFDEKADEYMEQYVKNCKKAYVAAHEKGLLVELCKKYNKRIINITEMIEPGLHDLTEDNTYHNDGIDAVENMWNTLDGYFQYEQLGYAYHYLDVIIELLEEEESLKPSEPAEPGEPVEPETPGESEEPEESELKISFTMPETAMVDTPFAISFESTNCVNFEWYVNGTIGRKL